MSLAGVAGDRELLESTPDEPAEVTDTD